MKVRHIPGVGDRVDLYETTDDGVKMVTMSPVDARHALEVDPKHWSLSPPAEPEAEVEAHEDETDGL